MIEILLLLTLGIGGFLILSYREKQREKRYKEEREKSRYEEPVYEDTAQERIRRELDAIVDAMVLDWNLTIYPDKVETPGNDTRIYRFENGDVLYFIGNDLTFNTRTRKVSYTVGFTYKAKFNAVFNRIVEIINSGKTGTRSGYRTQTFTSTSHPVDGKSRRYQILESTVKLRREGLAKMRRDDPNRVAMENELKAAEKKLASMK